MSYRLVRADIESEVDSDLDSGPTTFCCVPHFVAHILRKTESRFLSPEGIYLHVCACISDHDIIRRRRTWGRT